MQIKEIQLHRSDLRFPPKSKDLQSANKDLEDGLRFARKRELKAARKSRINCESNFKGNYSNSPAGDYTTTVRFRPSVEITKNLMEEIVKQTNRTTGLNFDQSNNTRDFSYVVPSGLHLFKEPWDYTSGWTSSAIHCRVRIEFVGNPDNRQKQSLFAIADEVYAPQKRKEMGHESEWWTEFDRYGIFGIFASGGFRHLDGEGGDYPYCAIDKIFTGDISGETENNVKIFYQQVRDTILEQDICEGCKGSKGKPYAAELKDSRGVDLHKEISTSILEKKIEYGLKIGIVTFQPEGILLKNTEGLH